jgi:hypothetical protein
MSRQSASEQWLWYRYQDSVPSGSGDMARNFKNEGRRDIDPGLFSQSPISNPARFLAREAIQNTVDASRDEKFTRIMGDGPVEVVFRFVELVGEAKRKFIETSSLDQIAARRTHLPEGAAARESENCLDHLADDSPLMLLYVDEHGASGMYGPWDHEMGGSKMSVAMYSQNISDKPASAGGAFGHGKSVNAMASKIRVNIAYTCFQEDPLEPKVTRRLLGVTYWPFHRFEGPRFTGFGLFGERRQTGINEVAIPYTNRDADALAEQLGFQLRTESVRELCGTSMLIIDPDLDFDDLMRAVERYWWPAISDGKLRVKLISPDGNVHPVRPRLNPVLRGFENAYQAIRMPSGHADSEIRVREGSRVDILGMKSGDIAMIPAISIGQDSDETKQTSLVAYVRGLGMVVKYRSLAIGPAFVHGVFLSHQEREIETLLNKSEPKTHYDWGTGDDEPNAETREKIRLLVQNINNSVLREVKDYSRSLTPPEDDRPIRFKELDKELRDLINDGGGGPPPPGERDFSIRRSPRPTKRAIGNDSIQVSGKVTFQRTAPDANWCRFTIRYFLPDEVSRGKPLAISIDPPPGFSQTPDDPHSYIGECGDDPFEVKWATPPYDRTWIGELDVEAEKHVP